VKTKSKLLFVGLAVLITVVMAFSYSDASGKNPFKRILFKLNKIIHLLEDEVIPGLDCEHPAGVPKTGQTECYETDGNIIDCAGTGQDGEYQYGTPCPEPRFTDNSNGTVTDNCTGLIWLKNANCFGIRAWATALNDTIVLASGSCGLTDGSIAGDWRLPNVKELQSLIDFGNENPALPSGHPFTGVQYQYWSSTTRIDSSGDAWVVYMGYGHVHDLNMASDYSVWPVRGGN
jgi:hypothetical protein